MISDSLDMDNSMAGITKKLTSRFRVGFQN